MMKLILKRTLGVLMILALTLVVLGCNETTVTTTTSVTENLDTPALSDPNAVFFQGNGYSVTYGELFEEFKINDGITQLTSMVDLDLLSDYIAAVTAQEVAEKILYLTYGTADAAEIAALDAETKTQYEDDYVKNMELLGYAGREEIYLKLICAKEKYSIDQLFDVKNEDESWYVGDTTMETYYANSYFEDVTALKIRFYNSEDAVQVMRHFNLITKQSKLLLYTGTVPLDQVPTSSLDSTNTRELTNAELLTYFIKMYNYVYGEYRSVLSETATVAELKANTDLLVSYTELSSIQTGLAGFVFSTLSDYESFAASETTTRCYTFEPVKYYGTADTATYMILKVSAPDKVAFSSISTELHDALREEMIENSLTSADFYASRLADLRSECGFTINDYFLGVDYQNFDVEYEVTTTGHTSIVASYLSGTETVEITADELLAFAMGTNASLYSLYASQMEYAMSTYFPLVYCQDSETCEIDVTQNTSAKVTEHWETLEALETSFDESYYAMYYTFDQFMYIAYGARSEQEMIADYYVKSTLQPYLIYDELKSDNWALLTDFIYPLIQDYYDNYFSLSVDTVTIYVDRDEDGIADVYADFVADLTDPVAYATLLGNLQTQIRTFLAISTNTPASLVTEYNKALRTNATWGVFKQYGIYLKTEDLSSEASLTYLDAVDAYEDVLLEAFIAAYNEYLLEANNDLDTLIYSQNIETAGGIVVLYCQKGTGFTKPTAQFTMTYDANNQPLYAVGTENTGNLPTVAQLKLYCEYRFYEIVYGTGDDVETTYGFTFPKIPTSVIAAMEAYFQDLHDSMYVVGFLNLIMSDLMQTGTFTNANQTYCTTSEAVLKAKIASLRGIYFDQVFAAFDTVE
jgi:hypothetical protein